MARLFLVRHGEPEAAWGGGVDDPGLTNSGREQAARAADQLASLGPLQVRSSPMRRCRETAEPYLTKVAISAPRIDNAFGEVRTPAGVGDRRAWLQEMFPWRAGASARAWQDVDADLLDWRDSVVAHARATDRDTVAFTHFIATNAIVGAAMGRGETIVFRPDYASITELEVSDGALRVRALGAEMQTGEVR